MANVALANLALEMFVLRQLFSAFGVWGTCKGRLGKLRKKGAGGTRGYGHMKPAH